MLFVWCISVFLCAVAVVVDVFGPVFVVSALLLCVLRVLALHGVGRLLHGVVVSMCDIFPVGVCVCAVVVLPRHLHCVTTQASPSVA